MRWFGGMRRAAGAMIWGGLACGVVGLQTARAQDASASYPHLGPIEHYLMDRSAEVALARSAAPAAISRNATVLVLGRHGYETAVRGTNGFVCMVERGWLATFDWPDRWNPKIRGADCLNPLAARSVLPLAEMRTAMVLAGHTTQQIVDSIHAALRDGKVPALQPGAMSYMLGSGSYLTASGGNLPHLMFYMPLQDSTVLGTGLSGSPVVASPSYWFTSAPANPTLTGLPPLRIFIVAVRNWSDGTDPQGAGK